MRARAVIGANFGDEGKGLVTDYLANKGGDVVVRFNGGAQAGHTVVTPEGQRHVFSHFGSGTLAGLPTYWSQFAIMNPIAFINEGFPLNMIEAPNPPFYAHAGCLVTTPWDMDRNQYRERERGLMKHGSCGMGIFETIRRHKKFPLIMQDLWSTPARLRTKVRKIRRSYGRNDEADYNTEINFLDTCERVAQNVSPASMVSFTDPIFEGAQGILLGQENMEMYPHLTPSYCGMRNVRALAYEGSFKVTETYYVSRTYLTRHGVGPLPTTSMKDLEVLHTDKTNVENEWQGKLRFAPLHVPSLKQRIHADCDKPKLVFTHCDVWSPMDFWKKAAMYSYGETRNDIQINRSKSNAKRNITSSKSDRAVSAHL